MSTIRCPDCGAGLATPSDPHLCHTRWKTQAHMAELLRAPAGALAGSSPPKGVAHAACPICAEPVSPIDAAHVCKDTYTTSAVTNAPSIPISAKDIDKALQDLKSRMKEGKWTLVNPYGVAYQGTVQQLLPLLLEHHPLLKNTQDPVRPFREEP